MTEPGSTPPPIPPGSVASSPSVTTPGEGSPARDAAGTGGPPRGDERLASAFTRIADEQLAEQRAVAGVLADLRVRLSHFETFPAEIDTAMARRISELAAAMQDAFRPRLDDVGSGLAGVAAEVETLGAQVDGFGHLVDAFGSQIEARGTQLTGLSTQVGDLGVQVGGMRTGFEDLAGRLAPVSRTIESLDSGIANLDRGVANLDSGINDLGDGLAGMRTDLRLLPEQVGGAVGGRLAESLETLREGIGNATSELGLLREAALVETGPDPAIAGLEEQLGDLAARLDALTLLQDEMLGLRTRVSELGSSLPTGPDAGLSVGIAGLRSALDELAGIPGQLADVAVVLIALQERADAPPAGDLRLDDLAEDATEDASLAPLGDLAAALSIVSTGVASLSESVAMLAIDVTSVTQRLSEIDERIDANGMETVGRLAEVAEATLRVAEAPPAGPAAVTAAELADVTQPLTGEVASLRADFDNVRRLLLEELPNDDGIDAVALAADVSAPVTASVTTAVTEAVGDLIRVEISQALVTALDAVLDRVTTRQEQTEARLFEHVDEAVLALAEIVLQPANAIPRFTEPSGVQTVNGWEDPPVQHIDYGLSPDPGTPLGDDEVAPGLAPEDPNA